MLIPSDAASRADAAAAARALAAAGPALRAAGVRATAVDATRARRGPVVAALRARGARTEVALLEPGRAPAEGAAAVAARLAELTRPPPRRRAPALDDYMAAQAAAGGDDGPVGESSALDDYHREMARRKIAAEPGPPGGQGGQARSGAQSAAQSAAPRSRPPGGARPDNLDLEPGNPQDDAMERALLERLG